MKLIHQIKTRWTLLGVTVSSAAGLVILARFMYIPYNGGNDLEGNFMGFKWLSSFLYSFGIELAFVLTGVVINFSTNFMEVTAGKVFRAFGWAVQFVGFFFLGWIFIDDSIFTESVEIAFSAGFAIGSVYLIILFSRFYRGRYSRLVQIIRGLFSFIYTETDQKGFIKDHMRDDYAKRRIDLVDNAVKNE